MFLLYITVLLFQFLVFRVLGFVFGFRLLEIWGQFFDILALILDDFSLFLALVL